MNIYFTSFNKTNNGEISDGWANINFIKKGGFNHFSTRVFDLTEADFVVYIRKYEGASFVFDTALAGNIISNNKKVIVFDYIEYGGSMMFADEYLYEHDFLGYKIEGKFKSRLLSDYKDSGIQLIEYLEAFASNKLIHCYFKRELSKMVDTSAASFPIFPCDYFNCDYSFPVESTADEFDKRNIDLLFTWGLSATDRPKLHGKILQEIEKFGNITMTQKHLDTCLKNEKKKLLFLYRAEAYDRINYNDYIPLCRTMIDLYGAGIKCFRNFESAIDSVSFKQDPSKLVYSYEWINNVNCIYLPNTKANKLDIDKSCDIIYDAIRINQGSLYKIYIESRKTAAKYENKSYSMNYIYPKIKNML